MLTVILRCIRMSAIPTGYPTDLEKVGAELDVARRRLRLATQEPATLTFGVEMSTILGGTILKVKFMSGLLKAYVRVRISEDHHYRTMAILACRGLERHHPPYRVSGWVDLMEGG